MVSLSESSPAHGGATWRRAAYIALAAGCVAVAALSYRFLAMGLDGAFNDSGVMAAHLAASRLAFAAHVAASPIALGLGWLQFHSGLRAARPRLHRWCGRIFVIAVLVGGASGLLLALSGAADRPAAAAGFGLLAILWIATAAFGVQAARRGRFDAHRAWMIYAFALTAAALTLRLQLGVAAVFGIDYDAAAGVLAWSCWLPNAAFAAWWSRRSTRRSAQSFHLELKRVSP